MLAPAIAATYGYTTAFAVSAALLGVGVIPAAVLLPGRYRLEEFRNAAAPALVPAPAPQPDKHAIPVAPVGCSPVITHVSGPAATPAR